MAKNGVWHIDPLKRTASRGGVVFHFIRVGRSGWIEDCKTPGGLRALVGEYEGMSDRMEAVHQEARIAWQNYIGAGHSRAHCTHMARNHGWKDCPANTMAVAR